jgi:arginyl-tRNA synthetase
LKPIPHQLESLLRTAIQAAQNAGDLPAFEIPVIPVNPAKSPEHGDYASPVAMGLAKPARMKPLDIAQAIHKHLPAADLIASAEAMPPGFINIRLSQDWIRAQVEVLIQQGEAAFRQDVGMGRRAQVEFVSANPTGPLHIGRTRGAIIGDTLANILTACGWQVEREYYFNNAGRQMEMLGKSLRARYLQQLGQDVPLPDEGYQGGYLVEIAQKLCSEVGDSWAEKGWQDFKAYAEAGIFEMIKATLKRVGIVHDYFFNEQWVYDDNSVWEVLDRLRAAGYIYDAVSRDGATEQEVAKAQRENAQPAIWFRSTALGDSEDRVVVKANGDPTYVLPDIAYHVHKLHRGFDRIVDIFGSDHQVEAQTVARGLTALGYDASKVDVVLHQFVTFPEGIKMSTRAGNYVTLDDLIDDVGADVVRYFMLGRSHNTHIEFDLKLAREQSRDNPVYYIQNAHVRCCGIFRQLAERGLPDNWDDGADLSLLGAAEMSFIRKALELPEQLLLAHDNLAPHQIAFWTLDLARLFHPLYDEVRVLHSEVPEDVAKARLRFYRMARGVFAYALKLMGMSAPERM